MRGQSSIEFLLVLLALTALFLALVPAYNQASKASEWSVIAGQETLFLSTVANDLKNARLLGKGNMLFNEFFLPAEKTRIFFNEEDESLNACFEKNELQACKKEVLGFTIEFKEKTFSKRKIKAIATNDEELKLSIQAVD